jgi:hypothetical protein
MHSAMGGRAGREESAQGGPQENEEEKEVDKEDEVEVRKDDRSRSELMWQELETIPVEAIKVYTSWEEAAKDRMKPFSSPPGLAPPAPAAPRAPKEGTYMEIKKHLEAIRREQRQARGQILNHVDDKQKNRKFVEFAKKKAGAKQDLIQVQMQHIRAQGGSPVVRKKLELRPAPGPLRKGHNVCIPKEGGLILCVAPNAAPPVVTIDSAPNQTTLLPGPPKPRVVTFDPKVVGETTTPRSPLVRRRGGTHNNLSRWEERADCSPYPPPQERQQGKFEGEQIDRTPIKRVWRAKPVSLGLTTEGHSQGGTRWQPIVTGKNI